MQEAEEPIQNFLMLRNTQIRSTGSPTGALWCQSANNDTHNGTWYQPPGNMPPGYTVVPTEDIDDNFYDYHPYQMVTCSGQVGLLRDTSTSYNQGLLQCVIRDEQNITHTLTAGVYSAIKYDNYREYELFQVYCYDKYSLFLAGPVVDPNMQFTLLSTRDADPPQFTLKFNSSYGPPTTVECTVNGVLLNNSLYTVSREVKIPRFVINSDLYMPVPLLEDSQDVTEVTVTVNVRQSGVYRCNVIVLGRNISSPQQVVTLGTGYSTANIQGILPYFCASTSKFF